MRDCRLQVHVQKLCWTQRYDHVTQLPGTVSAWYLLYIRVGHRTSTTRHRYVSSFRHWRHHAGVSNVDQTYRNLLIQHVIGTVPAIYSCSVSRSDDILLISSSITNLERLLHRCEHELVWLDMSINLKKNHPVYESALAVMQRVLSLLYSSTGRSLPWVEEVRYLGVHFVKSRSLKCSLDEAKRGFFFMPLMLFLERLEG